MSKKKTVKQRILDKVSDTVGRFLYYDRKDDDDLPVGAIEKAIKDGKITVDEIIAEFRSGFAKAAKS